MCQALFIAVEHSSVRNKIPFPHGTHTSFVKFKYDNIVELLAYSTCPIWTWKHRVLATGPPGKPTEVLSFH